MSRASVLLRLRFPTHCENTSGFPAASMPRRVERGNRDPQRLPPPAPAVANARLACAIGRDQNDVELGHPLAIRRGKVQRNSHAKVGRHRFGDPGDARMRNGKAIPDGGRPRHFAAPQRAIDRRCAQSLRAGDHYADRTERFPATGNVDIELDLLRAQPLHRCFHSVPPSKSHSRRPPLRERRMNRGRIGAGHARRSRNDTSQNISAASASSRQVRFRGVLRHQNDQQVAHRLAVRRVERNRNCRADERRDRLRQSRHTRMRDGESLAERGGPDLFPLDETCVHVLRRPIRAAPRRIGKCPPTRAPWWARRGREVCRPGCSIAAMALRGAAARSRPRRSLAATAIDGETGFSIVDSLKVR